MKILRFVIFGFILAVGGQTIFAQRQSILVAPQTTDPNITTNLNNHYVSLSRRNYSSRKLSRPCLKEA